MIVLPKNLKFILLALLASTALLVAGNGWADVSDKADVSLDGTHEVPSNVSTASGIGTFSVAADKSVSGSVTTKGLDGTAAHIHVGAVGKSGPIIVKLIKSGADTWIVPADSKLTDAQYESFKSGNFYVNVHSAAYPAGEIRGQLFSN
jgi:hypothetical protein